jgi:hypothetical protein
MENQEVKTLPTPALTAEQVQSIINYANDVLPTRYGKDILAFIEKVAIALEGNAVPLTEPISE